MRTSLGGLDAVVVQKDTSGCDQVVVLCHGYGAPGDDLVSLAEALTHWQPRLARTRFVFPAAPLQIEPGYGGRAWWPLDMETLLALQHGSPEALRAFRNQEPAGLAASRAALKRVLEALMVQTKLPMAKLIVGGFSQGSMLATDVALRTEEAPGALVILSGTPLMEQTWTARARLRTAMPVFQSHGRRDQVLRFDEAERLRHTLTEAGLSVEFVPFDDGHTIPIDVLQRMGTFLVARLS